MLNQENWSTYVEQLMAVKPAGVVNDPWLHTTEAYSDFSQWLEAFGRPNNLESLETYLFEEVDML